MLPCVFSVIDHRRPENVVRTSVTHSAIASCATFLFLPHFDVICDLILNRRTATWNLFVKYIHTCIKVMEEINSGRLRSIISYEHKVILLAFYENGIISTKREMGSTIRETAAQTQLSEAQVKSVSSKQQLHSNSLECVKD